MRTEGRLYYPGKKISIRHLGTGGIRSTPEYHDVQKTMQQHIERERIKAEKTAREEAKKEQANELVAIAVLAAD